MFEKDAEEYQIKTRESFTPLEQICWGNIYKAFKDGAEFGYNKANEWHFVKDGDLPKEDCLVYYKEAMGIFSCSFVHPSHYIAGVESFFKANPQIIAWKEIVLPELKESE